jgi:hypothetical protein
LDKIIMIINRFKLKNMLSLYTVFEKKNVFEEDLKVSNPSETKCNKYVSHETFPSLTQGIIERHVCLTNWKIRAT